MRCSASSCTTRRCTRARRCTLSVVWTRRAELRLINCGPSPASAPALARLLSGGALAELSIANGGERLLDAPAAQLMAGALRSDRPTKGALAGGAPLLETSACRWCRLWLAAADAAHAAVVLDALAEHPSVSDVQLCANVAHNEAAGAAVATLHAHHAVATLISRAPAQRCVNVDACYLGSEGLGAVVDALADGARATLARDA
jgi:hypothetical protein